MAQERCCLQARTKLTMHQEALKHTARTFARAEQRRPGEKTAEHRAELARIKASIADAKTQLENHEAEHAGEVVPA
jgi:hypothetical protein